MTLLKLKLNLERQRRQLLEEEIEKLRREITMTGYVQRKLFWQEQERGKSKIYILYFYLYVSLYFFYYDMMKGNKSHFTEIQKKTVACLWQTK